MRFKRLYALLIPVFMVSLLVIPAIPSARATDPDEIVRVFAPTANGEGSFGISYGWTNSMKLDNTPIALMDDGGYVKTYHYVNPSYVNYWAPYDNRSNFPPDNATILSISMITILRCAAPRWFSLTMNFWNGTGWTYMYGGAYNAQMADTLYSVNVTALYDWNATHITDYMSYVLSVVVVAGGGTTHAIYIDYVGIDYIWTNATTAGGGDPETEFAVMNLDVSGMMGIVGFVGMIGVPAASIWFFRHDGGSKIYIGVMALVAFTVCFGFFLGSINGG